MSVGAVDGGRPDGRPPPSPLSCHQRWLQRIDAYERLVRLDKPIGILLLLWPTLTALWIARWGTPPWSLVLIFTMGTVLMRCAGCAFNDWADRNFDAHVQRTAQRPLARGEIAPWEALVVAAVCALAAFALVWFTNRTTFVYSFAALAVAATYPFFKRFFVLPQAYLGIAFSFGIPMAFAAVYNDVPARGWILFALNLLWVMAYDTEYAMVDRDDDVKLGLRTSAIAFGRFDVVAVAICYVAYLAGMAWYGDARGLRGYYYAGVAVAAAFAAYHIWLIRNRDRDGCFRAFLSNHWLGFALFVGVVADYALRQHVWPREF